MSASTEPRRATKQYYELLLLTPIGLVRVPYSIWAFARSLGSATAWREI